VTKDEKGKGPRLRVKEPVAEAEFCRAQKPASATIGDVVENDLEGCMRTVEDGWYVKSSKLPWAMVLLDLCFYTGRVTEESNRKNLGEAEGRPGDESADSYFGLTILDTIRKRFPELPVVILSSMPRDQVSRRFSKIGASGFIDRMADESAGLLEDYLWHEGLFPDTSGTLVGHSKPMLLALRSARRASAVRRNFLIRGQRGSGKDLIARYIHANSENPGAPYVHVNLGGTNSELYQSLLFGHVKGAFTGADRDRTGLIVQADGGTLFMDEIAGIPSEVQYGLLDVVEKGRVTPLGTDKATYVDVHFISATNEDIESRAASGHGFRYDLLDRLRENGTLLMPPLSERSADIPMLVEKFVREAEASDPDTVRREISPELIERLMTYDWPGNVRDLKHLVFQAVTTHKYVEHFHPEHFPDLPSTAIGGVGEPESVSYPHPPVELDDVLRLLQRFDFSSMSQTDLTGLLNKLELVWGQFLGQYLKVVLERTLKPTNGSIQITTAINLAKGELHKTSKAADVIKALLKGIDCSQPGQELLREALKLALKTRPTKKRG